MSKKKIVSTDILLEFLEIALHGILYYRKLYPDEAFVKRKVYGIIVHISQHPELYEYIKNVLTSLQTLIQVDESNIKVINLLCLDENKRPIEKFIFHLDRLGSNLSETDPYFMKTEDALRSLCLRLSLLGTYLKPLPINSSFVINIIASHTAHIAFTETPKYYNFPWVINDNLDDIDSTLILPIKNIKTDYLTLQCYAVEDNNLHFN